MSTHLGLTARVFGASEYILCGDNDQAILDSLNDVKGRFGGNMIARHESPPLGFIRNFIANGGIAVDTNAFTVAGGTGNTAIGGTLAVTGSITGKKNICVQ